MSDPTCPGSPASFHSKCKVHVSFTQSCAVVAIEILARIAGEQGFIDPHNAGTYSLLESSDSHVLGQRITGSGSTTHYTDHFLFTFVAPSGQQAGCDVTACSESQGMSLYDMSTNYCNMHVLYCTGSEGCPSVSQPSLEFTETTIDCTHGSSVENDPQQCLPDGYGDNRTPRPPPPSALAPAPDAILLPPPLPQSAPSPANVLAQPPPSHASSPTVLLPTPSPPPPVAPPMLPPVAPPFSPRAEVAERPVYVTVGAILLVAALVAGVLRMVFGKKRSAGAVMTSGVATVTETSSAGGGEFNMELNDAAKQAMAQHT